MNSVKVHLTLFAAIVLLCSDASVLFAQNSKTGYINVAQLYSQLPQVQRLQREIEELSKKAQADLDQKRQALEKRNAGFYNIKGDKDLGPKSSAEVTARHARLAAETETFNKEVDLIQQELVAEKDKRYNLLKEKISKAVKEVALERGYSAVEDAGTMLYFPVADDITALVLAKLTSNQ